MVHSVKIQTQGKGVYGGTGGGGVTEKQMTTKVSHMNVHYTADFCACTQPDAHTRIHSSMHAHTYACRHTHSHTDCVDAEVSWH